METKNIYKKHSDSACFTFLLQTSANKYDVSGINFFASLNKSLNINYD